MDESQFSSLPRLYFHGGRLCLLCLHGGRLCFHDRLLCKLYRQTLSRRSLELGAVVSPRLGHESLKLCSHLEALSQQLHNIVECRSGIKLAFNRTKAYRVTETYAQATNRIYNITQTADIYSRPPTLLS
jgi:hypothetical protein